MASITVEPLRDDLPFGARIFGATQASLKDPDVRRRINAVFEDRGLVIFKGVEASGEMQLAISDVFGPLKDHPVKMVARVDQDTMPGVIEVRANPETSPIVEIDGRKLLGWLPWHFDHSYNDELNRAGVLRAVKIAPEGGLTGFADGIQLYNDMAPALRERIEGRRILYTLDLRYSIMRFGLPATFRPVRDQDPRIVEAAKALPRAIHPAVWTRASGEKVLHLSPWGAQGIEGLETPEGDRLFEEVCQTLLAKIRPYFHSWSPDEMIIWDNWRMLHSASGVAPDQHRLMHRTTIKGDYGLGCFEHGGQGSELLEMTV
jgi:taurine dioxygenase